MKSVYKLENLVFCESKDTREDAVLFLTWQLLLKSSYRGKNDTFLIVKLARVYNI